MDCEIETHCWNFTTCKNLLTGERFRSSTHFSAVSLMDTSPKSTTDSKPPGVTVAGCPLQATIKCGNFPAKCKNIHKSKKLERFPQCKINSSIQMHFSVHVFTVFGCHPHSTTSSFLSTLSTYQTFFYAVYILNFLEKLKKILVI